MAKVMEALKDLNKEQLQELDFEVRVALMEMEAANE